MSQRTSSVSYGGLLSDLMTNAMDRDYRAVADAKAARPSRAPRSHRRSVVTVAAVIALFGIMAGVSGLRTARQRPAAEAQRAQIVAQVHSRQHRLDALQSQLGSLETQVGDLQRGASRASSREQDLRSTLVGLGATAGSGPVTGPGVSILTDNAPGSGSQTEGGVILDTDLQNLVNALWQAGAEAIAINGHRITSLTAIRYAGEAITVDYHSLTPPYRVDAIGDPNTLPARLLDTAGGQAWLTLQRDFHIEFVTTVEQSLRLPGESPLDLREAHVGGTR